jgi:mitogen-activated protein kinase 1/3/mitogen-activated protein kinase 6
MHSAGVLHRDLKPRNLLVNSNCDLKICDFGLARPVIGDIKVKTSQMTDYVATRWYRAPELLLTYKNYTSAMDIWSVGCIFGELLLRKPLLPGTDANHQLEIIFNLIGTPETEDIQKIPHPRSREKVLRMAKKPAKDFATVFRNANPLALDVLKGLLTFDPDKRITIEQALEHPYLEGLHFPDDEPTTTPVSLYDFEFERQILTMNELKDLMFEEILLYHFSDKRQEYERAKTEYLATHRPTLSFLHNNEESDEEMA